MLEFNTAGLLTPSSIITSTLSEFERYFAIDSPENIRRNLFDNYLNYKNELKEVCGINELKQWIDGSFVMKKARSDDIDLVSFIDFEMFESKETELKKSVYPASTVNYGLDCYLIVTYSEGHKSHFFYKSDCAYWINQFDKTKPDRKHKRIPKGFLEIIV
jgi:hypothetical protein